MSTELDRPAVPTTEETQEELQREPGKPDPQEDPAPTPELSPRARAEKEIWKAANERAVKEASEPLPPNPDAPAAETPPADAPAKPETVAADAPAVVEDPEVELIVNGKPTKVKQSQILDVGKRAMQKDYAADAKLEIASKLLREAEERAGKVPPAQAGAQPPASPSKPSVEKTDAQLAEDLQYGTKEQAASAIAEIRRRDSGVDPQAAMQEFQKQLPDLISSQLAFHSAVREAQSSYKDIFADPHLTTLFHVEEHRLRQAGDARPHADLYKDIGDGIRKHFKLPAPAVNPGPTLEQKRETKAATPSVPRSATARVDAGEDKKAMTPEQNRERALDAMKKARGQNDSIRKY
jgi:hypothetical protein